MPKVAQFRQPCAENRKGVVHVPNVVCPILPSLLSINEHFLSDERDRIRHMDLAGDSI